MLKQTGMKLSRIYNLKCIYFTFQRTFRNDMDNSLTISGTMSLDTGKYTCVASNGIDEDSAGAQLTVQGDCSGVIK